MLRRGSLLLLIHSSDFQEWVYKRLPIIACCQEQRFSTMFVGHSVLHRDAANQTDSRQHYPTVRTVGDWAEESEMPFQLNRFHSETRFLVRFDQ